MSDSNDSGDKTEKPTPKKLQDARKKGDVAKSKDITSTAGMLAILLLAALALPLLGEQIAALVSASFEVLHEPFELALPRLGRQAAQTLLLVVGLVVVPVALVGALVEFIQAGPVLAAEKLKPKLENMNPAKGLKRMFSMNNLVELVKSILKTAVVATIAWLVMKQVLPELPLLVGGRVESVGSALWHTTWTLLAWAGGSFVLVSAMDLAWQRYSFTKKMRMSMRDIRQEMKDAEGDPHLKGQRRQLQQEWAQQGASNAAAEAHVLVVNPTHVAIAIAYHRDACPVPTVTAKGEDDDALVMRQAAQDAGVPVLRNIELARSLLADARTGEIVPQELFDIIATVVLWAQDVRHELARARPSRAGRCRRAAGPEAAPAPRAAGRGSDALRPGPRRARRGRRHRHPPAPSPLRALRAAPLAQRTARPPRPADGRPGRAALSGTTSTPAAASIEAATTGGGMASAGLWSSLLVTMLALAFVLALAWLFLRLLRRTTALRSADGRAPPQVVQAVPLGGRERLVVVRDGGVEYVLGVTAASVSLIDKRATDTPPTSIDAT